MTTATIDHIFFDKETRAGLQESNGPSAIDTAEAIATQIIQQQRELTWEELSVVVKNMFGYVPGIYDQNPIIRPLINIKMPDELKKMISAAVDMLLQHPRSK